MTYTIYLPGKSLPPRKRPTVIFDRSSIRIIPPEPPREPVEVPESQPIISQPTRPFQPLLF